MIQLKNVTLRRSAKVLLDAASVTLNPGEKVGLVGRNGAGKSTLFALFNGTLHEDGGDFGGEAAEDHSLGVDDVPARLDVGGLGVGGLAGHAGVLHCRRPGWAENRER